MSYRCDSCGNTENFYQDRTVYGNVQCSQTNVRHYVNGDGDVCDTDYSNDEIEYHDYYEEDTEWETTHCGECDNRVEWNGSNIAGTPPKRINTPTTDKLMKELVQEVNKKC